MSTNYKTLHEAIGHALHSLNAGGVPVILRRRESPRESLREIRLRWEHGPACGGMPRNPPRPWGDSNRGKLILEERRHIMGAFVEWEAFSHDAALFNLADVYNDCFHEPEPWEVYHPHHAAQDGYPCPGCIAKENKAPQMPHDKKCIAGRLL